MTTDKPSATVLGLGPMGRAISTALLTADVRTTIWNRTAGKGDDLVAAGATETAAVSDAIDASSVIIACLLDYAAVRSVVQKTDLNWNGRVLVNLASGTPAEATDFMAWARARGVRYLEGAILTPTPTIGTPGGVILFSGNKVEYESLSTIRSALAGTTVDLGDEMGLANAFDVSLLDVFATAVHGVVHGFALARAQQIAPTAFARFATGIGAMLPEMITRFAQQLEHDSYPGEHSTISSARSGITHIIETADASGLDASALRATQHTIERAIRDGHGEAGLALLSRYV
ncbi:NAD(P)-dependent oxidoreductase [Humibacter ginsengisoli]